MTDIDKRTGTERILDGLRESDTDQSLIEHVVAQFISPASNGDLIDLFYEQLGVNIKIGNALTQSLGDNTEAKFEAVNSALDAFRTQSQSFAKLTKRIILIEVDVPKAGE